MYQLINEYQFRDAFLQNDTYKNNFTYDGLTILFDWLEELAQDTGDETPFDMVSIACEFSEASPREIFDAFDDIEPMEDDDGHWLAVREYLEDNGSYVGHTDSTIIYINH
jgi:hypothetical protein